VAPEADQGCFRGCFGGIWLCVRKLGTVPLNQEQGDVLQGVRHLHAKFQAGTGLGCGAQSWTVAQVHVSVRIGRGRSHRGDVEDQS
jgi:hypothetical protein